MKMVNIDLLTERELLNTRICDLGLSLRKTRLMKGVNKLFFELNEKLINFHPHIWLGDDWFSPDGVAGFSIPFYLTHPKLIELEKKNIGFVEGTSFHSLLKLLRHETAHALDNAFHLRKNKLRQKLFGLSSQAYPKTYLPNPRSKNYVRNLDEHYAQAHPDEDWAETFAVWLNPKSDWGHKYAQWEAIFKLELVDEMILSLPKQRCFNTQPVSCSSQDTRTLKEYYREKKKELGIKRPIIQKIDTEILPYVVNNKTEVKKILLKQQGLDSYIVNKFLKDISQECKSQKIPLNYNSQVCKSLLAQQLELVSKTYVKQGRHRIIM